MKLNIKARLVRKHDNKDDLVIALDNSVRRSCLESKGASNSQFVKIATITFLCDRYDPTRAGSCIVFSQNLGGLRSRASIPNMRLSLGRGGHPKLRVLQKRTENKTNNKIQSATKHSYT